MRILLISQAWEPDEGPPHRRLRRFADALVNAGHQVGVVTAPPHYPGGFLTSTDPRHIPGSIDANESGLTVYRTAFRTHSQSLSSRILDQAVVALSTVKVALSLRRTGERPEIVLASVPALPSAVSALLIAKLYRIPLVIDLRDAWPDLLGSATSWGPSAANSNSTRLRIRRAAIRWAASAAEAFILLVFRHARLVITTSHHLERSLSARLSCSVVTIVNSAATDIGQSRETDQAPRVPVSSALRVLYGGTVGRAQGLTNAIRAADIATRGGASIRLRIVGQGAELAAVRRLASDLDAPVEFIDPVAQEKMAEHYHWCDAALIHLRDWEPLERTIPSKLIEAMARRIPVIAAANGETADITRATGSGTAVAAMDPYALSDVFKDWSRYGAPKPDEAAVRAWLESNADPRRNDARFVHLIESATNQTSNRRLSLGDRALRFAGLLQRATEIGRDDPVHLLTLVSRRLSPDARAAITRFSSSFAPAGAIRGFAYVIGDEHSRAEAEYAAARNGRIRDYLGFHLNKGSGTSRRNMVARRAWELGDMDGAIALVRPTSRTATRWASTRKVLEPGFQLETEGGRPVELPKPLVERLAKLGAEETGEHPRPARVLHVLTNSLPHTDSGYAVRSHAILRSENAAGIVAVAVTRLGYPESIGVPSGRVFDVVDGVTYARLTDHTVPLAADRRLGRYAEHLLAVARAFRPDVLHTTTNFENALVTREVARRTGLPWVYETRGEMEQTWLSRHAAGDYAKATKSQFYHRVRATETQMMKAADAVIALSFVQKRSHAERGVPSEKIHVVRNSVDKAALAIPLKPSWSARTRLGLPEKFTVGTVSSLVGYEGIDNLLHAISLLRLAGYDVHGAVVGDGAARPDLQTLSTSLGLEEAVTFPGRVPYDDTVDWYDAIDVFCIPRRDVHVTRSVTPLKPLQAMARQRPLVVSDLDALTEVTTDLGAGIAVAPDDANALANAILRLMNDRPLYGRCATAGRLAAERSTWETAVSTYASVYTSLRGAAR